MSWKILNCEANGKNYLKKATIKLYRSRFWCDFIHCIEFVSQVSRMHVTSHSAKCSSRCMCFDINYNKALSFYSPTNHTIAVVNIILISYWTILYHLSWYFIQMKIIKTWMYQLATERKFMIITVFCAVLLVHKLVRTLIVRYF